MKFIRTESFMKIASDYKREPGSLPGENNSNQSALFEGRESKEKKLKRKNRIPTKPIYQLGVQIPNAEKLEVGTL